jgi:CRISPR/Cas system-associated exonuclease Cas4 (RecB family)
VLDRIINIDYHESMINFTADYIFKSNKKTIMISGGKRPFLFLKKKLAEKKGKSFFAPEFFTNDEFIENIIFYTTEFIKISDIEAAFIIFEIIKCYMPQLLNANFSFASFMEWSFEILYFIEQLDLENISEEKLIAIKANAEIGYDVPENINNLLKNIFKIRENFHTSLEKISKITRGYSFLKIASIKADILIGHFDEIILMAPFYLYKTETTIFKKIYNTGKLTIFTQGDPREYGVLERLYSDFGVPLPHIKNKKDAYKLNVYSAFDDQSQCALLKNLISKYSKNNLNKTVIIISESKMLQPLISEISMVTDKYNVSIGYPAAKTAVFSLLNAIIQAQFSRKEQYYYSRDIMKVLNNPLFRNIKFFEESSLSKIIAHRVEKVLDQNSKSYLSGKIFISFKEIVSERKLIDEISFNITEVWKYISPEKIMIILNEIFIDFFISWEKINTFNNLSNVIFKFLEKIDSSSDINNYPLNSEAIEILLFLAKEMKFGVVSQVKFSTEDILNIFKKLIKNKRIALSGSSIDGLQILGLWESRNLSFDNVFIIGMTDSAMPAIKKEYSFIPKDIMYAIGIEMTKKEFEIQKYHFNRLISNTKNLNLIYPDNDKNDRSRFIESIIWNEQLKNKDMNTVKINKFILPKFSIKPPTKRKYVKTKEIKEYLKNMFYTYSKIDTYLNCKLKFYFMHVLLLDEGVKIGYEISNSDIGVFIHNFLKETFHEKLENKKLHTLEFEKEYFKKLENNFNNCQNFKFREDAFMIKEVLIHRMKNILFLEKQRSYKNIYKCEKKYISSIETETGEIYNLNCRIDRIDTNGKDYMIFDYKTGITLDTIISKRYFNLLSSIFTRKNIKKIVSSLQIPLYKYIFEKETGFITSESGIYDIKRGKINKFPEEKEVYKKCIHIIKVIINEINTGEYFEFDEEDKVNCKICKYFYICR